jgi:hypothetical protein
MHCGSYAVTRSLAVLNLDRKVFDLMVLQEIRGDGTPTSDSSVALVSDGEFIVNAKAASKNKACLAAINSGKPRNI